jgi:Caspase domain
MTDRPEQIPNIYALLIGIDCYMPNKLPDGSRYKNLGGCVRDITHVETFLINEWKVPKAQILKLTASVNPNEPTKPLELPEKLPTRQNTIDAFRKLGEMATEKAQVYIHYSGHGGRAKTVFPSIKGEDEIDEGLVPTDIGTSEGQYLRDLDLAILLKELVDKQLTVTVVLDCCNSGGTTRGDVEIRGGEGIDEKPLQPGQEMVAPLEILEQTWRSLAEQTTRGLKASGLRAARDYVLLAACRQNEFAYEYAFNRETKERNGALTYWLLDTLRQQNPGQTYQDLFDRINAKIHSQFPQQTPILMGENNRVIFGNELAERVHTVPVLKVDKNAETGEKQAVLGVGQANGIGKGAEFAIYPRTTTDLTKKENRVAIARIIQRGATDSLCKLEPIYGEELNVEDGDRAVLVSPSVNLVRKVYLIAQEAASAEDLAKSSLPPNKLLPEIFKQQDKALEAIKNALPGNGWVELAEEVVAADDDEGVVYQVVVNNQEEYEICDRTGYPFQGIPPIQASDRDAAATVVKRLVHLAKYHATAELDNTDKDAPLAGKLIVEWLGTSDIYELGDKTPPKSQLKPFADASKPTVKLGDCVFLSIQNNSFQAFNVAVLDLASDWSIQQIAPGKAEKFITIEAGKKETIAISATSEGEDIVKILATVGPIDYRWLELPSLDEDIQPKGLFRSGNPLEVLLEAIDKDQPPTRKLSVARSPSREWTTKQVSLTITK